MISQPACTTMPRPRRKSPRIEVATYSQELPNPVRGVHHQQRTVMPYLSQIPRKTTNQDVEETHIETETAHHHADEITKVANSSVTLRSHEIMACAPTTQLSSANNSSPPPNHRLDQAMKPTKALLVNFVPTSRPPKITPPPPAATVALEQSTVALKKTSRNGSAERASLLIALRVLCRRQPTQAKNSSIEMST